MTHHLAIPSSNYHPLPTISRTNDQMTNHHFAFLTPFTRNQSQKAMASLLVQVLGEKPSIFGFGCSNIWCWSDFLGCFLRNFWCIHGIVGSCWIDFCCMFDIHSSWCFYALVDPTRVQEVFSSRLPRDGKTSASNNQLVYSDFSGWSWFIRWSWLPTHS